MIENEVVDEETTNWMLLLMKMASNDEEPCFTKKDYGDFGCFCEWIMKKKTTLDWLMRKTDENYDLWAFQNRIEHFDGDEIRLDSSILQSNRLRTNFDEQEAWSKFKKCSLFQKLEICTKHCKTCNTSRLFPTSSNRNGLFRPLKGWFQSGFVNVWSQP